MINIILDILQWAAIVYLLWAVYLLGQAIKGLIVTVDCSIEIIDSIKEWIKGLGKENKK